MFNTHYQKILLLITQRFFILISEKYLMLINQNCLTHISQKCLMFKNIHKIFESRISYTFMTHFDETTATNSYKTSNLKLKLLKHSININ